jgi:hypothetical protein
MAVMAAMALCAGEALAARSGSRSASHGGSHGASGGSHGHGGHYGGNHGGNYGGYRGYYRSYFHGGRAFVAAPFYAFPGYYYPPPAYYALPPQDILYYCPEYGVYYPQVQVCPSGWQRMLPQAPPY